MDPIAKTSLLTAAMRAVESKRSANNRLFVDRWAESLAGEEGFLILKKAIEVAGDQPAIAIRTYFIDQQIKMAIESGVKQIIILAAGMDTRAFRLQIPSDITLYELDRIEIFDYKNFILRNVKPTCSRICIPVDLTLDWTKQLTEYSFDSKQKTLWIVEGLIMYLNEEQVIELFKKIDLSNSVGDYLILDVLSQTLLQSPYMANQLKFLRELGAPWRFGTNDPEHFFSKWGWKIQLTQAGEVAPARWPFPFAPLSVPNVPRGYFVSGIKSKV